MDDRAASTAPADDAPADLRRAVERGQLADRELAGALGRRKPVRSSDAGRYAQSLEPRPALSRVQEQRLIAAARTGDQQARAQLVEVYLPHIASLARTYRSGSVQRQELLQEGVVGLLRALERFEPARGVPFWAYAGWWVRQAMQQLVSELTRPIVLSDRALRNLAKLKQAHHDTLQRTGRQPSGAELAVQTGLDRSQVDDLLAAERTPRALDAPAGGEEDEVGTFGDLLVDPLAEDAYERVLAAITVEELHGVLAGLSERERRVLRERYGLDGPERTLREIGEELGLSAERVRQIERRGLAKLASVMATPES